MRHAGFGVMDNKNMEDFDENELKRKRLSHLPLGLLLFFSLMLYQLSFSFPTQSVTELKNNYSGTTYWDASANTLTFSKSGTINFDKQNFKNHYWDIPQEVSTIIIDPNVTVTGAFHTYYDCTILGRDRTTSIVFGTKEQSWAENRNLTAWEYCQFQNRGGILVVKNLTVLNPFSYFIRGWGKVCHAKNCNFIDNRGGWHNHSDGFAGGHGSSIDKCYFECGDDVIKCYFDITVTNTTIKMVQNSVPFQFGWNTYQHSNTKMSNITIIGGWGRGQACPLFQWKAGADHKTVSIDGFVVDNPKASLFELLSNGILNLDIKNAQINVQHYGTSSFPGIRTICNTTTPNNSYNCTISETNSTSP